MNIGYSIRLRNFCRLAVLPMLCPLLLIACANDDDVMRGQPTTTVSRQHIVFGMHKENGQDMGAGSSTVTRGGMPLSAVDGSIGLFGYLYKSSEGWKDNMSPAGTKPTFMYNALVQKDSLWKTANTFQPPSKMESAKDSVIRYYAYYPYTADGSNGIQIHNDDIIAEGGAPLFTFYVNQKVSEQCDLMVGQSEYGNPPSIEIAADHATDTNKIVMRHMLTAIAFKVGKMSPNSTLKTIKLKNAKTYAYFNGNEPKDAAGEWECYGSGDFCDTVSYYHTGSNYDEHGELVPKSITDSTHYFLMLPINNLQDQGVKLEIVLNDGNGDTTLVENLSGRWQRSKIVTYTISISKMLKMSLQAVKIVDWDAYPDQNVEVTDKSFVNLNSHIIDWDEDEEVTNGDNKHKTLDAYDNGLAFSEPTAIATVGEAFTPPELVNPHELAVTWESSDETVATVDSDGLVTILAAGTTTIRAVFAGSDSYNAGSASYELTVSSAAPPEP